MKSISGIRTEAPGVELLHVFHPTGIRRLSGEIEKKTTEIPKVISAYLVTGSRVPSMRKYQTEW